MYDDDDSGSITAIEMAAMLKWVFPMSIVLQAQSKFKRATALPIHKSMIFNL